MQEFVRHQYGKSSKLKIHKLEILNNCQFLKKNPPQKRNKKIIIDTELDSIYGNDRTNPLSALISRHSLWKHINNVENFKYNPSLQEWQLHFLCRGKSILHTPGSLEVKPLRVDHLQMAHLKRAADPSFILIPQETLTIHTQVGPLLPSGQTASPTPRKRITIAHHSTISTWRDHHKSSSRAFAAVIRIFHLFRSSPCRYRSWPLKTQRMTRSCLLSRSPGEHHLAPSPTADNLWLSSGGLVASPDNNIQFLFPRV